MVADYAFAQPAMQAGRLAPARAAMLSFIGISKFI
jgi:hypothetical protein